MSTLGLGAVLALTMAAGGWSQPLPENRSGGSSNERGAAPAVATIGVEEVSRGQRGYGLTVFAGAEPERFDVEVVGVLRNMNPGVSFILAELSGHGLEQSGVAGGMSGSPVYIDDRLAGAVAFSWAFSNGALAGITPIAAMRELQAVSTEGVVVGASDAPLPRANSGAAPPPSHPFQMDDLLVRGDGKERLRQALDSLSLPRPLENSRAGYQLSLSGFDGSAFDLLQQGWTRRGVATTSGGRASADADLPELAPGSTVIGMLVGGDLQMAVSGTVTDRTDDDVLAFGHPFLGIGPMNIPMAKGEVVTVVSSKASSFKITNTGPVVGAFVQDLLAGLRGVVGPIPRTTPMTIRLSGDHQRDYSLEFADLEAMRPGLVGVALLQAIEAGARSAGEQSLDLRARFELAGYPTLEIEQSFDGASAAFDAAIYLLQVTAFLELNTWVDLEVESIDVAVDVSERLRGLKLVDAFPSRSTVRPGEEIRLHLTFEAIRGERTRRDIDFEIPPDASAGPYYLFVGDGVSTDAVKLQMLPRSARRFEDNLEILGSFRSARELVVLGVRSGRGLTFDGRALSDLPASVRALWSTARKTEIKRTNLVVTHDVAVRQPQPIDGVVRIDLRVEEETL